jgi:hypothetical protein
MGKTLHNAKIPNLYHRQGEKVLRLWQSWRWIRVRHEAGTLLKKRVWLNEAAQFPFNNGRGLKLTTGPEEP